MGIVNVNTSKPYDIIIGRNILKNIGDEIKKLKKSPKICVITDTNVNNLYAKQIVETLKSDFEVISYEFVAGEQSKTMQVIGDIVEFMAKNEMTRTDIVVAVGGGVVGDMAGFVSAIYLRSIDFVQVPTSLLAMVDSSVGGKTGADLNAGKNLVGAFHQPILVLCDIDNLNTLTEPVFAEGVAEIIKYGVLGNDELFYKIENGLNKDDLEEIVTTCVSMKRDIVVEDEFDNGKRQLLNLGHTLGHSIEQLSNFTLPHGYAVAIGMCLVATIAESMGIAESGTFDKIHNSLINNNLPTKTDFNAQEITKGAMKDKKRRGNELSLILPEKIGVCRIEKVAVDTVEDLVKKAIG